MRSAGSRGGEARRLQSAGASRLGPWGSSFARSEIAFGHAYRSVSERACDALELTCDMPYTRVRGLKEMNFGKLEGSPDYL